MNGRTAKLIKKVAKHRGARHRRYISALKRVWYGLNKHERAEKRKEWQDEIKSAEPQITRTK